MFDPSPFHLDIHRSSISFAFLFSLTHSELTRANAIIIARTILMFAAVNFKR
jgi:hypothetical protein